MQAMGRAECWQVDADGRLRRPLLRAQDDAADGQPWVEREGLELSDETPTGGEPWD
jgi:hypothetical protein